MRCLVLVVFVASLAAQAPPAFEVASVKPNQIGMGGGEGSKRQKVDFAPGTLTMQRQPDHRDPLGIPGPGFPDRRPRMARRSAL